MIRFLCKIYIDEECNWPACCQYWQKIITESTLYYTLTNSNALLLWDLWKVLNNSLGIWQRSWKVPDLTELMENTVLYFFKLSSRLTLPAKWNFLLSITSVLKWMKCNYVLLKKSWKENIKSNRNNSIFCSCSNKRPNSNKRSLLRKNLYVSVTSNISSQCTNSNYVLSSVEPCAHGSVLSSGSIIPRSHNLTTARAINRIFNIVLTSSCFSLQLHHDGLVQHLLRRRCFTF